MQVAMMERTRLEERTRSAERTHLVERSLLGETLAKDGTVTNTVGATNLALKRRAVAEGLLKTVPSLVLLETTVLLLAMTRKFFPQMRKQVLVKIRPTPSMLNYRCMAFITSTSINNNVFPRWHWI